MNAFVYIVCHLLHLLYHLAVVAGFVWLAYQLRTPWVLLGIMLCVQSYKHDYKPAPKPEIPPFRESSF